MIMEDIRPYRMDEEDTPDERELATSPNEDEVPFHIPRD
jgi:hypothetical protein